MPPSVVELNNKIMVATISARPPLKRAQVRKIFSVTVIVASLVTLGPSKH
jgi:hypothetical protein